MPEPVYLGTLQTRALGLIGVAVSPAGLRRVRMFLSGPEDFLKLNRSLEERGVEYSSRHTAVYLAEIQAYLEGRRRYFTLPVDWSGLTDFQTRVLQETARIPYGETRTYGEIAAAIGNPKAARAVGQAERANPAPLVIPCHRVIGADGSMTGYGGKAGTATKAWLLDFEKSRRA